MAGGRRGNGEGSIYQKKDGTWIAALTLRGARRKYYSAKTRREAQDKLRQAQQELAVGLPVETSRQRLDAYLLYWMRDVKVGLKPESRRLYQWCIDAFIDPTIGHVRLGELEAAHVHHVLAAVLKAGNGAGSQRACYAVLSGALRQAERELRIGRNVCRLVPHPAQPTSPARHLTPTEAQRLRQAAASHRLGAMVVMGMALTMRNAEMRALRWADHPKVRAAKGPRSTVDLETGWVTIGAQLQRVKGEGLVLVEPKGKRPRQVLAPPGLLALLRHHRAQQAEERLRAGGLWNDQGFVFSTPHGQPYAFLTPVTVTRELCQAAELPPLRYHDLRHTGATLLLNTPGIDLHNVSWTLGHASVAITADLYGQAQERHARQVAAGMEAALWGEGQVSDG